MSIEVKYNGEWYKATRTHLGLYIGELKLIIPMVMRRPGVLSLAA